MDATFTGEDQLGIWLQIYNLAMDETTHKANAVIAYKVLQGDKEIAKFSETTEQLQQTGEQVTLEKLMPLGSLTPGKYKLEISITDNVVKKTVSPSAEFTVKAAEKTGARTAANSQ
jgi:hypothetical protein